MTRPLSITDRRLPNLVIIGAQKAASTFLQQLLARHPEIYLPWGETPFFESPDYEKGSLSDLGSLFINREETVLGIKRPNYLGKPEVPPRIAAGLPEAKLIAVLREPVSRLISAYYEYMMGSFIPVLPAEEGVGRLLNDPTYIEQYPRAAELLEFGRYAHYLSMYTPFIEKGRLKVLLQEDVAADGLRVARGLFEYLHVDPDVVITPEALSRRPKAVPYDLRRVRLNALASDIQFTFNADRTRSTGFRPNPLRRATAKAILGVDRYMLGRVVKNRKPKLSDQLTGQVRNFYRDDISQLGEAFGLTIEPWLQST